ncbi:MAG: Tim44/TimA family putative adaptor protein [Hyphomicrobiales bacterium]|jgi:predicted lipid-binding transport protein (Tim44 family)|nr:Tim44/TimA family putative adaptor protein [Hyphomicrobiales bacterium]
MLDIINIILLIVVVFIFLVLRSVLGKRTGLEKQIIQDIKEVKQPIKKDIITNDNIDNEGLTKLEKKFDNELKFLYKNDKQFTLEYFTEGVKKAYEMILVAYSEENTSLLKSLLSQNIYEEFNESINIRNEKFQKLEYSLIKVEDVKIQDIIINKNVVRIKVLINALNNSIISQIKDDEKVNKRNNSNVNETWSFDKNINSSDPNWKVAEIDRLN